MKIRTRRRRPSVSVNAMSDIAFLLLIFIMLISLMNYRQEIPIEYPEATHPERTQADRNFEIWVQKDGFLYVDGEQVSQNQLESLIAEAITSDPTVRIHVLADQATPYRHVAGVFEVLQLLQHRVVSLVTGDPTGGSPTGGTP